MEPREKNAEKYLSADIVKYLKAQGMTLREIGERIGCSESFVCYVGKGQRAFTTNHLASLEKSLGVPLPLLLLESVDEASLSNKMRPLYRSLRRLITKPSKSDRTTPHKQYNVKHVKMRRKKLATA